MKKLRILFIIGITVGLYACKHTGPDPLTTPPGGGGGTGGGGGSGTGTTAVCFESEVLPIFQSNCAKSNCHDASSHNEGYVFDSYANIVRKDVRPFNASNSKVYKVLFEDDDDRMPKYPNPPLTADQKNLIGRWINEGAKNTTNCATSCNAAEFKYTANIKPILETHCTGCHSGSAPAGGVNLTSYATVYPVRNLMLSRITHPDESLRMPRGQPKLADCKISQIRSWIQAGAPNN